MMNLKFNAMKIAEIEDEKNSPLATMIDDFKMSTLALFIEKGGEISREEAYRKIDEELATGKETQEVLLDILEMVQRDGFLPKIMDIQTIREQMIQKKKEIRKTLLKG
jgi:hypothetical protein